MVSSDFLSRVTAYPLVSSAFQRATDGLSWAKDRSAYARAAVGIAESGLRRVADGAGPLLTRYEGRIAELDRLACRQLLDRLETACPTVLQPTDKVVERSRGFYSESVMPKVAIVMSPVTAAVSKVQSAKAAGLQRYRQAVGSRQGQAGLRQFDHLMQLLGDCLDKFMPPALDQKAKESPRQTGTADDGESKESGSGENKETGDEAAADPAHSLALAIELGRQVSLRVSDRVADWAGRFSTTGHHLADRLFGRSANPSVAPAAAAAAPSKSTARPPSDEAAADSDEAAEESQLDRSDMSTD